MTSRINKYIKLSAGLFIVSLVVLFIGMVVLTTYQNSNNELTEFEKTSDGYGYIARLDANKKGSRFYVVGDYTQQGKLPHLNSISVEILREGDNNRLLNISSYSSSSGGAEGRNLYRYTSIFYDFKIEKAGEYEIFIQGDRIDKRIKDVRFSIHSNPKTIIQGFFVLIGFLTLCLSLLGGLVIAFIMGVKELRKLMNNKHV